MRSKSLLSFAAIAFVLIGSQLATAEEAIDDHQRPVREIFVPFDDLNVLLEGDTRRVFLTRQEYEQLLKKAKRTPEEHAPHGNLLLSADYLTTVEQGRAIIEAVLTLELLEPELQVVPLDLRGVGIRRAMLEGEPAALGRDEQGQTLLFVRGAGEKRLTLNLVTPLITSAAQQSLQFKLPTPPATTHHLTVPGNVEVRGGAAVINREVNEAANVTHFDLLAQPGHVSLVISLNNRLLLQQRVVMARSVLVDEVTQAFERLHATLSFEVLHGAVDQFELQVPEGFEITDVQSAELARWVIEQADGERVLQLKLREPVTGQVTMNVAAIKNSIDFDDWRMPNLRPLDVANHVAVVGLLLEDRLTANAIDFSELIPLDNNVLQQALPESVFEVEPGAPRLRTVGAFFAPQAEFGLKAHFTKPPARFDAQTAALLTLSEKEQHLRATLTLTPAIEKLFEVDIVEPDGWQVTAITDARGSSVAFERMPADDNMPKRVHIRLPDGVTTGTDLALTIEARSVPTGWLDEWSSTSADFPAFTVLGAADTIGAIAVQTLDDLQAGPDQLSGLTPLAASERAALGLPESEGLLAFRIDEANYAATFALARREPRITARTMNFLRIQPEGLNARYEIIYDIQRARTRRLSVLLPESTPLSISMSGLDATQVQEFTSEAAEDGWRRWTARLAEAALGQVRLAMSFEQTLDDAELADLDLPLARAADVAYQSYVVAIEGSPEFDVEVRTDGRKLDVGELAEANHQVGRRLLGAYGFLQAPAVSLNVARRPAYGLPAAITERVEFVTLVSASGLSQTAARYHLRTKAAYLQFTLPSADARLWSATVDGKPATPQRDADDLLISLPPKPDGTLRDLQIVFETPVNPIAFMEEIETAAPRLAVRSEDGQQRYEVPTADVQWQLVLPEGHRIVRTGGSVFTDQLDSRRSPAAVVGKILYRLAGGVQPLGWLQSRASSRVGASREEAATANTESAESTDAAGAATLAEQATRLAAGPVPADEVVQLESTRDQDADALRMDAAREPQSPLAAKKYWALEGVRSLRIDLDRSGDSVAFQSMGAGPRLRATLIQGARLQFLAWGVALLVGVIGLLNVDASPRRKVCLVITLLVVTLGAAPMIGLLFDLELSAVFEPAFYVAAGLVPFYLLVGAVRWILSRLPAWMPSRAVTTAALMLLTALPSSLTNAQDAAARATLDHEELLLLLEPGKPVHLPEDAVIIPYDPDSEAGTAQAEKVLVPYDEYVRLWNLAFPDRPMEAVGPPAAYALAGATYSTRLDGDEHSLLTGRIDLQVYVDGPVEIPLPLGGGVLERATLDGRPARLRTIEPQPPTASEQAAEARPRAESSLLVLYVDSPGRKQLDVTLRFRLQRSGGWRILQGRVPVAPATALQLTVPQSQTEIRLASVADRSTFETESENQTIETALGWEGELNLQWRPRVATGQIDQSLTAQSVGLFDVREDGLYLTWQLTLATRSQRETFTVVVPGDYLVDAVRGNNVRGWQSRQNGDSRQVDITLLEAATGSESITLQLSRREVIGAGESFRTPRVEVPEALLHQGSLAIRRGPLLDLRVNNAQGASRAELDEATLAGVLSAVSEESPLGLVHFQNYRFGVDTFQLGLSARTIQPEVNVEEQALLRIAERETTFESRLKFTIKDRPLHQLQVDLPEDLDLSEAIVPGLLDWEVSTDQGRKLLTVYLNQGALGEVNLDLRGTLPPAADESYSAPRLVVRDAQRQSGYLVVQVDPSVRVTTTELTNAEEVPLSRVSGWLTDEQRQLAGVAVFHREADFVAAFRVTPRRPLVSGISISNARVTSREIETTLFLQFRIRDAGIHEVVFLMPAALQSADITVPLLRQKTIEPVADDPDTVRVRLELQDEVIGELIVLVQHRQPLSADAFDVPVPVLETGTTEERYAVLEGAGRDEVVVTNSEGFTELNRQLSPWRRLAQVLGNSITQAYAARRDATTPRLAIQTRERATIQTAGARIGLADALLMVDGSGAYRGVQQYRVDNQTEQYLEIELPAGADLWTVQVAGEAVKPSIAPNTPSNPRVRVPLIKTQTGDLDFAVVVKYGGKLDTFRARRSVDFPLLRTVNINVEQSHVRLRLPETHRWVNFGGTMSRVDDVQELTADFLAYRTKQLQDLIQVLKSGSSDAFSKVRAANSVNNMRQLGLAVHNYHDTYRRSDNLRLQSELASNSAVIVEAERQLQAQQLAQSGQQDFDNNWRFRSLYDQQRANRSKNVVSDLGNNFDVGRLAADRSSPASNLNGAWLRDNRLNNEPDEAKKETRRISEVDGVQLGGAGKALEKLQQSFGELSKDGRLAGAKDAEEQFERNRSEIGRQLERYQQQLQQQAAPNTYYSAPGVPADMSDLAQSYDAPNMPGQTRSAQPGGFGGGGMAGEGEPFAESMITAAQAPASGLASLDVNLAERGTEYLFTTPRGDVRITAYPLQATYLDRLTVLSWLAIAVFGLFALYRVIRLLQSKLSGRVLAGLLILLGLASVMTVVFPVVGLLAIVAGIWMLIARGWRSSRDMASAA